MIQHAHEVLRCQAPHPAAEKFGADRAHGILLPVRYPHPLRLVRFVGTLDEVAPGRVGVLCLHRDCRVVHEFQPVNEEVA